MSECERHKQNARGPRVVRDGTGRKAGTRETRPAAPRTHLDFSSGPWSGSSMCTSSKLFSRWTVLSSPREAASSAGPSKASALSVPWGSCPYTSTNSSSGSRSHVGHHPGPSGFSTAPAARACLPSLESMSRMGLACRNTAPTAMRTAATRYGTSSGWSDCTPSSTTARPPAGWPRRHGSLGERVRSMVASPATGRRCSAIPRAGRRT
mmetsp:Transcript_6068/g.20705  ORF Transcript_6068/g.20705 Transcript_6068/m.20705 type:complete len:208 (+) Transcript_6068:2283-2906(+)